MNDLPNKPRSIRLRSFYGFSPEEDGYLGWSEEGARDRMLELIEDGDLFLIYGAASADTSKNERHRALGLSKPQFADARRLATVLFNSIFQHDRSSSKCVHEKAQSTLGIRLAYLALLWQINPRLVMIGHLWHFNRGAKDGRAGCCTDGMAEAVR